MKSKMMILVGVLALMASLTLSAWDVQAAEKVTLKVVSRTWAKAEIEWAAKQLQANHPDLDITVDYSIYEYNECRTQLGIRLSRKEPLDVITLDHIWLGEFKNMIMPFAPQDVEGYEDFIPSFRTLLEKYAEEGNTLGLYGTTDVRLIYWNKELMAKVGIEEVKIETWDDVKKYAELIKAKEDLLPEGVKPVGFMAGGTEHTNSRWYDYVWTAGGDILSADESRAAFNDDAGVQALEFYGWFLKNGMVAPEDVLSPANGGIYDEAFLNGKFVISLGNGHWIGQDTAGNIGMSREDFLKKFDAAMMPAPVAGGQRGASVAGGYMWSLSKFSKNPELAKEFLYLITGPLGYNEEGTGKQGIPTVQSALSTIDIIPYADVIKEALNEAHFRPTIPEYPKISEAIRDAIQKYVLNYEKMTAKEILDEAAARVDEILE
jgi:multiple sugar transport system substrate-binding protein